MRYNQSLYQRWLVILLTVAGLLNWTLLPASFTARADRSATAAGVPETALKPTLSDTTQARVRAAYGELPMRFERNQGQFDERVRFAARGTGYGLWLTGDEALLSLRSGERQAAVIRMKLVKANGKAQARGEDELPGHSNYFVGNDPEKWRSQMSNYAKVVYSEVYRGVDLVYYGKGGELEYDFKVAAGANPGAIGWRIEGAQQVRIDAAGEMVISTAAGEVRQRRGVAYQEVGGERRAVAARYELRGRNEVRIALGPYDRRQPLVIDPVLSYSTFLGGNQDDFGRGIAVDAAGNAYVVGVTSSANFPVVAGGFQTTLSGFENVFVTKLNAAGSALIYSTYIGGSRGEEGAAIAVDAVGNAYLTGDTSSTDFPVTAGAFQSPLTGQPMVFVTKLNASGSALLYSARMGGGDDRGNAITIDGAGNAYVAGVSYEGNFPVTPNAFQTTFRGGRDNVSEWGDAFMAKLNASGAQLVYATYLGGDDGESANSIAIDSSGNAYVTGSTGSTNFPTTPGALQTSFQSVNCPPGHLFACEDGFVTKLNPTGTALVYSTYLGGNGPDVGYGIAINANGEAFVTGNTVSSNFPTANALQPTFKGYRDLFVSRLNASGSALIYSTYLGGSGDDQAGAIAIDAANVAYITGTTASTDFPTVNPIQATLGGGYDAFVAKLNASGSALGYSTYLGGDNYENLLGGAIAVDGLGNAYITGHTRSANFPTTPGAFQTAFGGGGSPGSPPADAFVAKITDADSSDICLQDDSNGNLLRFNVITGAYQFTNCRKGITLAGTGVVKVNFCKIQLHDSAAEHSVSAQVNICTHAGSAQVSVSGRSFTIADKDSTNNTCGCH